MRCSHILRLTTQVLPPIWPLIGSYSGKTANKSIDSYTPSVPDASGSGNDTSTSNDNASNAGGSDNSVAIGVGAGVEVGIPALLAAVLWQWWRRRLPARQARSTERARQATARVQVDRAHMLGNDVQKHELEQPWAGWPTGDASQELLARHGRGELDRNTSATGYVGVCTCFKVLRVQWTMNVELELVTSTESSERQTSVLVQSVMCR